MKFLARVVATSLIATLGVFNLRTQFLYLDQSERANQASEVMLERLAGLGQVPPGISVMLDIPEVGIDNLVALYTRGHPAPKYSGDLWVLGLGLAGKGDTDFPHLASPVLPPLASPVWRDVRQLGLKLIDSFRPLTFSLTSEPPQQHEFHRFLLPDKAPTAGAVMVTAAADQSVINQSTNRPEVGRFYVRGLTEVRNHLAQVESSLGHIIMPGITDNIALWQREPDFAAPSRGLQATGRHMLFEVVNPVPGSRMLLEWTRGGDRDEFALPAPEVFGDNRSGFGFVGRGAARMLSEPLVPRNIDGHFYVAVDMHSEPQRILTEGKGLVARRITGYARNISLLAEDEVDAMKPPESLSRFPADLFDPGLLFSGLYEDGWIAEVARIRLGSDKRAGVIRVRGQVSGSDRAGAGTTIEVMVDGQEVARRQLNSGDFELQAAIPVAAGPRWIELRADATDRISTADQRVASIRLVALELIEDSPEQARALLPPQAIKSFPADLLKPGLSLSGIYNDGWVTEVARLQLRSEKKVGRIRVKGNVPGFNRLRAGTTIDVVIDGQEVARRQLRPGEFELEAAIPETEGPRWIELRADTTDRISTADQRVASIRLISLELLEDSPEQARASMPPQAIKSFPADLLQPGLSFSGIYDDGWVAEIARIRLGSETEVGKVRIKGEVPGFNRLRAGTTIGVVVDGQEVARRQFRPGNFELEATIPVAAGARWIELRADTTDRLSAADRRVASIRLMSLELIEDSPEQAGALPPPQAIKSFPADLLKPGLSFSGIYDDGWVAEIARIRLGSEKEVGRIRVKGEIPGFNRLRAGATIGVVVDGQEVARRQFRAGEFELEAAIPSIAGPRWIELRADTTDRLSAADQRVASIRLISLELVEGSLAPARALLPPQAIKSFPVDLLKPGLSFSGIYDDGWIAEVARIGLGSEKKVGRLRVKGEVPGFNRLRAGATIGVVVDGQEVARRQFGPGEFELEAAIPAVAGARWIELRADTTDRLSAADQRVASIRLISLELVEDSPEQAGALPLPQAIKSFPADLLQPGLWFSGIYDDGWVAEIARIRLGSEKKAGRIRIKGEVPSFNRLRAGATIGVVVDGQEVVRRQFRPGDFELEAAIPETEGPRWIEIRSDMSDHLSAADQRVASILLKSIELVESP
jgi:hypothetical protein